MYDIVQPATALSARYTERDIHLRIQTESNLSASNQHQLSELRGLVLYINTQIIFVICYCKFIDVFYKGPPFSGSVHKIFNCGRQPESILLYGLHLL